jgi:uncharacterized protein YndB with AHSA1/START domain
MNARSVVPFTPRLNAPVVHIFEAWTDDDAIQIQVAVF